MIIANVSQSYWWYEIEISVFSSLGTKPYYSITQVPLHISIWPLSQYKRPSELDTQAMFSHAKGRQGCTSSNLWSIKKNQRSLALKMLLYLLAMNGYPTTSAKILMFLDKKQFKPLKVREAIFNFDWHVPVTDTCQVTSLCVCADDVTSALTGAWRHRVVNITFIDS